MPACAYAQVVATATSQAQPVAGGQDDALRCEVVGGVVNLLRGDGLSAVTKQKMSIPVAVIEVDSVQPADDSPNGLFCRAMVGEGKQGAKPTIFFRVCDAEAEFFVSDRIRAKAGKNLGGGLYCLEDIERGIELGEGQADVPAPEEIVEDEDAPTEDDIAE